jgi:hypothetical protein
VPWDADKVEWPGQKEVGAKVPQRMTAKISQKVTKMENTENLINFG